MKSIVCILLFSLSLNALSRNIQQELVLGEIQKTFIKDYGASESYWASKKGSKKDVVVDRSTKPFKPTKRVKTIKPVKPIKPIKKIVKKLKPVVEESDGYAKYKKRKKRGLIDDGEYIPYVAPKKKKQFKKKYTKKIAKSKPSNGDWMSQKMNDQSVWNQAKKSDLNKWEKAKKDMLQKWAVDKKKYFKRLPTYKKNLVSGEVFSSSGSFQSNNTKLETMFRGEGVVIIPNAFDMKIKDQGKRPTCSAFASTRALEISLAQGGIKKRLSDQYIYYASKPYCQQSPCSKKGSWALSAFEQSVKSSSRDIPSESSCPYSKTQKRGNETQIPLKNGCFRGEHKLKKFNQVKSLSQIVRALDRGQPVVSGFKLSPNFYRNKGVILHRDVKKSGKTDSHAAGHAILLVGYMKIPPSLNEGKVCFITANSWGVGWGKGGHACLSEKWVKNFRYNIPFLAVEKVI
jgi:C1A family cysteine protease